MLSARTIYGEIFDNDEAFGRSAPSPPAGRRRAGGRTARSRHWCWRRPKAAVVAAGIRGVYAYEQPGGWRRMVAMRRPARRNALGGPVPAQPSHA
jgi:hypothetical protein